MARTKMTARLSTPTPATEPVKSTDDAVNDMPERENGATNASVGNAERSKKRNTARMSIRDARAVQRMKLAGKDDDDVAIVVPVEKGTKILTDAEYAALDIPIVDHDRQMVSCLSVLLLLFLIATHLFRLILMVAAVCKLGEVFQEQDLDGGGAGSEVWGVSAS
jgi:hypothetical protein